MQPTTIESEGDCSTLVNGATAPSLSTPTGATGITFRVVDGPDRGLRALRSANGPARLLVGSSPICDVALHDRQVSRRHAAIEISPEGLKLTDLGSSNGTYVAGLRIGAAFLLGGETVRLGESSIVIDLHATAPPRELTTAMRFGRVVGGSPAMRRLYPLCERLAAADIPVLIEGETGTGKEVLAEALHESGERARNPFIVFDCTAVPPNLIESALFGHERGAFTGATDDRQGVFEQAHGGTLLIDEIGELDAALQPKLLRALERRQVQRVGSNKWIDVDVRVIAATRRDLDAEVQAGRFRDDLFYRLAVGRIELPPLRDRRGDVTLLARHFWRTLGPERAMPAGLVERLESYPWPGNVRELYNAIVRVVTLGDAGLTRKGVAIAEEPLPMTAGVDVIEAVLAQNLPLARARHKVVDVFERRYVERVLERYQGNVARAAAASGIARRYFQILRARQK